jgi:hypothetical protein
MDYGHEDERISRQLWGNFGFNHFNGRWIDSDPVFENIVVHPFNV